MSFKVLKLRVLVIALVGMSAMSACRGQTSTEPPMAPVRNMYNQPRYNPQAESTFFSDKRTMRPYLPGTVAREMAVDVELATGVLSNQSGYVLEVPSAVSQKIGGGIKAMLERGEQRYGIYCAPCHGLSGNGQGMIIKRGMLAPPSFHDPRLRSVPDGQVFTVISNGIGNMPSYRHAIPVNDRWAIVSYVRTLQLTQAMPEEEPSAGSTTRQEAAP